MSNKSGQNKKPANPCKAITGKDTRLCYPHVWEPYARDGEKQKYSCCAVIPKTDTETVEKIRKAIGVYRYAEYIYALCYLGYRPGEMLELRKDQVVEHNGRMFLVEGKKTDAGINRTVPVHQKIEEIIQAFESEPVRKAVAEWQVRLMEGKRPTLDDLKGV